jgi:predicted dehydrogenase
MSAIKNRRLTRRQLLGASAGAVTAVSIIPSHVLAAPGRSGAGDKLNIGCVGVGGMQGGGDVGSVSGQNIYALCDVDQRHLDKAAEKYKSAKVYRDFREMLDKEAKNLDAVTVTIPDHMHATVSLRAMEHGLAVHCQKPLTQTIWEARQMSLAAKKYKVATQMGNQGYSCEATREACEIIWSGLLGDITEVHSMSGGGFARGVKEWPKAQPVPDYLNWDIWMGRTQERPYGEKIHPIEWRGFLDYGTQMVGDWGVHMLGPSNWGLQLGNPTSIECTAVEGVNPVTYPSYACRFEFPERPNKYVPSGKMPALKLYWYEGSMVREFKLPEAVTREDMKRCNTLYVGTKGYMGTGDRGESVTLLPLSRVKDYQKPPQVLERVKGGHAGSWIQSVKDGKWTCSNFTVAGPYVEWLLLGTICWRFPNQKLLWDGAKMRFTNNEEANKFVKPNFRKGWELKEITG